MKLDRLPRHITGFFDDKSEAAGPLNFTEFKAACFQVARTAGGSIASFDHDLSGKSFFVATMKHPEGDASVLCNSVYPYVAFVPPGSFDNGAPELAFSQPIYFSSLFLQGTVFHPLDADWLMSAPGEDLLSDLALTEREQVRYWKVQRVGDIVFNRWD